MSKYQKIKYLKIKQDGLGLSYIYRNNTEDYGYIVYDPDTVYQRDYVRIMGNVTWSNPQKMVYYNLTK
ncbi:MAG: Uncharacterised protein [Cryomorphaceae bacterium]|nr:MAG: Uncharacterised protein [Cryomorphaceae bacterium]